MIRIQGCLQKYTPKQNEGKRKSHELTHKREGCCVEGSSAWDLGRFQMLPVGPFLPALSGCSGVALLDSFRSLQRELCLQRVSCSACCILGKHWIHESVKIILWAGKTVQTESETVGTQQVLTPARVLQLTWKLGTGIRTSSPQLGNICPAQFLTLIQGVR